MLLSDLVKQLDYIFNPRSVAVIGASSVPGKWGNMIFSSAISSAFRGPVYPVNPKGDDVMGVKAYKDVRDIPGEVDLAAFTVPAKHMPGVMAACVEKGVKGGVIVSADFAETGEEGERLQKETLAIAREGGIRFVGPNGNGIWSGSANLSLCPIPAAFPGPLSFVSQSGSFGGSAFAATMKQGFGLSKFISIGNQADLNSADYLEYLAEDDSTKVITLYVEGIKDGRRFIEAAKNAVRKKPVLIYKGGSSDLGARATLSHTASIAGKNAIFNSICRQTGMIQVKEIGHLFIMAEGLIAQPIPKGNRIAVLANGGQGVAIMDYMARMGLDAPEFLDSDKKRLKALMPPHAPIPNNPVDFAAGAMEPMEQVKIMEMLASFDYIDGIITNLPSERTMKRASVAERTRIAIDAMDLFSQIPKKYNKPVVVQRWMSSDYLNRIMHSAKLPMFDAPEDAARCMTALVKYGEIRRNMG